MLLFFFKQFHNSSSCEAINSLEKCLEMLLLIVTSLGEKMSKSVIIKWASPHVSHNIMIVVLNIHSSQCYFIKKRLGS